MIEPFAIFFPDKKIHHFGSPASFFLFPSKNLQVLWVVFGWPRLKVTLAWLVSPNEQLTQPRVSAIRRRKVGRDCYGGMDMAGGWGGAIGVAKVQAEMCQGRSTPIISI